MKPLTFMCIAGESSGDLLAAELVPALHDECAKRDLSFTPDAQPRRAPLAPRFFGAGGPNLAAADVDLACDLTSLSVIGLIEVLKHFRQFRRVFRQLLHLAGERQPDAVICVDFSGFNRRFAHALRQSLRSRRGTFNNWRPKIIQYVSPQVWASRPGRAEAMAHDVDLLLCIFPFEKDWYALRVPRLRVEFVGHPIVDRYASSEFKVQRSELKTPGALDGGTRGPSALGRDSSSLPLVLLLPGSREGELQRHLPVMVDAVRQMQATTRLRLEMILPSAELAEQARSLASSLPEMQIRSSGLGTALRQADLAIASTGTVTLECAWFGVPTVAIYRTSWGTYQVAKRLIQVNFLAMPNLLAGERIFPEFLQDAATPENIAREALDLLNNETRRAEVKRKLAKVVASLGGPGASQRAAKAIVDLLP